MIDAVLKHSPEDRIAPILRPVLWQEKAGKQAMIELPEYSVFEFYPDGTHTAVARGVSAEQAVTIAKRTTQKPAVLLGVIQKVMITDGSDFCVFLWEDGKVVFPPRKDKEEPA
jgi:hypothetical protein